MQLLTVDTFGMLVMTSAWDAEGPEFDSRPMLQRFLQKNQEVQFSASVIAILSCRFRDQVEHVNTGI